jgi:hypothetical protein
LHWHSKGHSTLCPANFLGAATIFRHVSVILIP